MIPIGIARMLTFSSCFDLIIMALSAAQRQLEMLSGIHVRYAPTYMTPACFSFLHEANQHPADTLILDIVAIAFGIWAIWHTSRRRAAVGRREMFLLLSFYILISVADIFTTGRVLADLGKATVLAFAAIQVALLTAFFWTLALFGTLAF